MIDVVGGADAGMAGGRECAVGGGVESWSRSPRPIGVEDERGGVCQQVRSSTPQASSIRRFLPSALAALLSVVSVRLVSVSSSSRLSAARLVCIFCRLKGSGSLNSIIKGVN